jgi:hypothetical protein
LIEREKIEQIEIIHLVSSRDLFKVIESELLQFIYDDDKKRTQVTALYDRMWMILHHINEGSRIIL